MQDNTQLDLLDIKLEEDTIEIEDKEAEMQQLHSERCQQISEIIHRVKNKHAEAITYRREHYYEERSEISDQYYFSLSNLLDDFGSEPYVMENEISLVDARELLDCLRALDKVVQNPYNLNYANALLITSKDLTDQNDLYIHLLNPPATWKQHCKTVAELVVGLGSLAMAFELENIAINEPVGSDKAVWYGVSGVGFVGLALVLLYSYCTNEKHHPSLKHFGVFAQHAVKFVEENNNHHRLQLAGRSQHS